jgi:hypothetical protein
MDTHFRTGLIQTLAEFLATRDEHELYEEFHGCYDDVLMDHSPFRQEFTLAELAQIKHFREQVVAAETEMEELLREAQRLLDVLKSG